MQPTFFALASRLIGTQVSMGSVGDAYDNSMAEGFFATLECELYLEDTEVP